MPNFLNALRTSPLRRAYDHLPAPVKQAYRSMLGYPQWHRWKKSPAGYCHAARILRPLQGRYHGCRAVLMGNGPSLKATPWDSLHGEFTFGLNRIYLLFDQMGFQPDFYVCIKDLVFAQFASEIQALPMLSFLDWEAAGGHITPTDTKLFIPYIPRERFQHDLLAGWHRGYTVTFAAMQVAYYLGFSELILIGVDHHFSQAGPARKEVTADGADNNHFAPDYFGKGVRWQLPDLPGSEVSYRLAKAAYEADGRRIVDATAGGQLQVFPKFELRAALAASPFLNRNQFNARQP